jgi:hypothetical protein
MSQHATPGVRDMAPGTTFTARHIDPEECGGIPTRWFVYWSEGNHLTNESGQQWSVGSIDQQSVRAVKSPPRIVDYSTGHAIEETT